MIREEKNLLLKDLCARLPYGVKCQYYDGDDAYTLLGIDGDELHVDSPVYDEGDGYVDVEYGKPYLRPMSSMTEEEVKDLVRVQILSKHGKEGGYVGLNNIKSFGRILFSDDCWYCDVTFNSVEGDYTTCFSVGRTNWGTTINEIDWLNKNMFDYRYLISRGFALEAPEGMYK